MVPPPSRRNRPHDKVFRRVFKRVEHARGALRRLVGEDVARQLDWRTLHVEPGTYVEEALRDLMSDLLFSVRFHGSNRRALVYLLWDHQRQPDRMMPLRLHNYGGRALYDYTKGKDAIRGYVPTLIPLLVYQGPGEWPGPYLLSELSHLPGEPEPPVFMDLSMIVHNLHDDALPPSELTLLAKTTFRLMRLAAQEELVLANAASIAGWLDEVHETYGYDDYRMLMEYIATTGKEAGMIDAIVEHTREDFKDAAMSTADWMRLQGFEKGLEKGRRMGLEKGRRMGLEKGRRMGLEKGRKEGLEGARTLLVRQLELRFGPLSARARAKVSTATRQQIEGWALRVVTGKSLTEVLGGR